MIESSSGDQAIEWFRVRRCEIDLVLLDVEMRGKDGMQTLRALQEIDPGVCCCFVTGGFVKYTEKELLRAGALRVLYKPFAVSSILEILTGSSLRRQHA